MTKLYLVRYEKILNEFFYQQILIRFGKHHSDDLVKYDNPISIYELLILALNNSEQSGWAQGDGSIEEIAKDLLTLLDDKGPMLFDYFGIEIKNDQIHQIPRLLPNTYVPSSLTLSEFLLQLSTEVDWDDEEECFDSIALILAKWYSELNIDAIELQDIDEESENEEKRNKAKNSILQNQIFPFLKASHHHSIKFQPSHKLKEKMDIMEVACLNNLYKIFERC